MKPPAPLQMSSYMGSCNGGRFKFFKNDDYANDLANNRREAGLFQAWADNQISAANLKAVLTPVQSAQPSRTSVLQNMVQRFVQMLPQPVQNFINRMVTIFEGPMATLTQFATKTRETVENLANKIVAFFFGDKKDKALEKEKRQQDDIKEENTFDDFFMKEPVKSNNDGRQ